MAQISRNPRRILITGASGELGAALARHYAAPQRMLLLWGRDMVRLEAVARACRTAGAEVELRSLDLCDTTAMLAALATQTATGAIDLALLAAGTGDMQAAEDAVEEATQIAATATINFTATITLAAALARDMIRHGAGGIVLVGSAAAFHALPFAAAYAGSKAGLARFADALRLGVGRYGVRVTLVSPGFIDTAAGRASAGRRPFLMQPADAAARIARSAARGRGHVIFPWPFAVLRWVDRLLPLPLRDRLLLALPPPR